VFKYSLLLTLFSEFRHKDTGILKMNFFLQVLQFW